MQLPYRGRCDETFNQSEVGNDKRYGVRNARKNKSFGVWSKNLTTNSTYQKNRKASIRNQVPKSFRYGNGSTTIMPLS